MNSLLEQLQGLIERTYGLEPLPDLDRFVIGDEGYRRFRTARSESVGSARLDARTLVRQTDVGVHAVVYYPDSLIETLEEHPPWRGLDHRNIDAFATLVEELDHLLLIAERSRHGRSVSLVELEMQAGVTKHLVLSRFLVDRSGRLSEARRRWLRYHLFDGVRYTDPDREVRRRYREAARWAVKFVERLREEQPKRRTRVLRRFHHQDLTGKLRLVA